MILVLVVDRIRSMNEIFADTNHNHWAALQVNRDRLHRYAVKAMSELPANSHIATSDLVLIEFLAHFCQSGKLARLAAIATWKDIRSGGGIFVVPVSPELVNRAGELYERASDKAWSLTDCSSFLIMRDRKIQDALSADHHFVQAGFRTLLPAL